MESSVGFETDSQFYPFAHVETSNFFLLSLLFYVKTMFSIWVEEYIFSILIKKSTTCRRCIKMSIRNSSYFFWTLLLSKYCPKMLSGVHLISSKIGIFINFVNTPFAWPIQIHRKMNWYKLLLHLNFRKFQEL